MLFRNAIVVYRKELMDALRDRRTVKSMILVPIFVFPLITVGMNDLTEHLAGRAKNEVARVMIMGGEDSPQLTASLRELPEITVVPSHPDYEKEITAKQIRAAIRVEPGFDAALAHGKQARIAVFYDKQELGSQLAAENLEKFFNDLRDKTAAANLAANHLSSTMLQPIVVEKDNISQTTDAAAGILGRLLPYFIIVLCLSGATTPALDLTAGEKERGTMETILCSPLSRTDLVIGKFLMVLTASLTTAILAITSMSICAIYGRKLMSSAAVASALPASVTAKGIISVFVLVLPLSVLFSGTLLALALFAKTFREAQSYVSPLMMLVVLPAAISFLPGMELKGKAMFIPVLNTSLACREILSGTFHWGSISMIFVTSCLYAIVAMVIAVRLFNSEEVLFRG